jgi:hypothetical protein
MSRTLLTLAAALFLVVTTTLFLRTQQPPPVPRRVIVFSWERGDVIGGFATKVASALTQLGVATVAVANEASPDYFWHTAYRSNHFTPPGLRPSQSVFYNLENMRVDPPPGETLLQTRHLEPDQLHNARILYVPWAWVAFEERYHKPNSSCLLRGREFDARAVLARKTRFCSFMASYCTYDVNYAQIYGARWQGVKQERTKFYELLNATYKAVDSLGRCYHNREQPKPPPNAARWSVHDQSIWTMRPYKFAMCWENMATPGYFTEKLFNAYMAEAIPIYWGDPLVDQRVNAEAFVWCREHEPWSKCIEQIKALDQDDELYLRMLSAPILKDNRIPSWMSYKVLAQKLMRIWRLKV